MTRQRRSFEAKLRLDEALEKNGVSAELEKRKEELMKALRNARAKRQEFMEPRLRGNLKEFVSEQMKAVVGEFRNRS